MREWVSEGVESGGVVFLTQRREDAKCAEVFGDRK